MGKRYTTEFKAEAVQLARSGDRPINPLADELGVSRAALRAWIAGAPPTSTIDETTEQENRRLRRENRVLQMERDILKKATAFFAKESR